MPTTFLAIAGLPAALAEPRLRAAMSWAPHEGEQHAAFSAPCGTVHGLARATMSQLLRAEPFAVSAERATFVDGYAVLGSGTSARLAGAAALAATIDDSQPALALDRVDGQPALVDLSAGRLLATAGFLGVQQLYVAEIPSPLGGVAAIVGNRPLLVASAAHGAQDGALPGVDAAMLGWLVSASRVPFGDDTVWRGVRLLGVDEVYVHRDGSGRVHRRPPVRPVAFDAEAQAAALVDRCRAIAGAELRFRLALTGGKDSRLVLAATIASGLIERVSHAYLKARDDNADVSVGRALAVRVGLPFCLVPPPVDDFGLDAVDRHLTLTGGMLGAWDLKAHARAPRLAGIHGGFGEVYKSHARPWSHLGVLGPVGWALGRQAYLSKRWIDPYGLLREAPRARIRATYARWLARCEADNQGLDDLHDRWHRECRMRRWLAQSLQAGAAVAPMVNPLGGHIHLAGYLGMPLSQRVEHRLHFEIFRVLDPALARLALADDRWAPALRRGARGEFEQPHCGTAARPPQRSFFARHAAAIAAELSASDDDGFADLVRVDVVKTLVNRATAAGTQGHNGQVEMALALLTMRRALAGRFAPMHIALDPAAD